MNKPTTEELQLLHDELCSALGDTTRLAIIYELADGPRHVSSIVAALDLPQATVSRHLRILREKSLVTPIREGNRVRYHLRERRVLDILALMREMLMDHLRHQTAAAERIRASRGGHKEKKR